VTTAVVTGGAGFLGSHLCQRLLDEGWKVVCLDSLITGRKENIEDLGNHPHFRFENRDVTESVEVDGGLEWVLHFASPASPRDYLARPIETLRAGSTGTLRGLELARAKGAGFLLASTSEVYGDPLQHPQPERYWGNVNPVGPRSVYDEAKRFSEAAAASYAREHGLEARIARIFNTYGPRMRPDDGRAVPTFVGQALRNDPLTVHGDGSQTRSLCYVDDMIDALWRLLNSDESGPINLGNPEEVTVRELAEAVRAAAGSGSGSEIILVDRPEDDPERRCPDITLARQSLGWEPRVTLAEGLQLTVAWAREAWAKGVR
jgi:dTDP-glucose 4,6-dehydratase